MKLAGALRFHAANHIAKDDEKALLIYQKCAAEGWDEAVITLAEIYKTGDLGVEADLTNASACWHPLPKEEMRKPCTNWGFCCCQTTAAGHRIGSPKRRKRDIGSRWNISGRHGKGSLGC